MASHFNVELTILSASNLKNVNWRHGDLSPYAVAWIDPSAKCSTKVDIDHDTDPEWNDKLTLPLPPNLSLRDATLFVDIVHADPDEGIKPLVGSARIPLSEIVDEVGIGGKLDKTLKLKRPSGRPQGKLELLVAVMEPPRYYDPYRQQPPTYGQSYGSRDYRDPYAYAPPSGYPYNTPPMAAPPAGYPYGGPPAGAPPPGGYPYGGSQTVYGQTATEKKSKFGMGTGLAVGAAAGVLGGLALAEGADYLEDKFEDDVAEKVEDDLTDDYGGDDF